MIGQNDYIFTPGFTPEHTQAFINALKKYWPSLTIETSNELGAEEIFIFKHPSIEQSCDREGVSKLVEQNYIYLINCPEQLTIVAHQNNERLIRRLEAIARVRV